MAVPTSYREVTCLVDGKTTIDKVRIKGGEGSIGFELSECRLAVKNVRLRAQPDPSWLLGEIKKIRD